MSSVVLSRSVACRNGAGWNPAGNEESVLCVEWTAAAFLGVFSNHNESPWRQGFCLSLRGQSILLSVIDSAPSLGIYYFLLLTLYVCVYVCHVSPSKKNRFFFLLLNGIEAFFWPSSLHVALYKMLFLDFWLRPLTPKIYSPKFACRSLSQS